MPLLANINKLPYSVRKNHLAMMTFWKVNFVFTLFWFPHYIYTFFLSVFTDPASGGSPVLVCPGPPGLPEAGGGPRQREDSGPGGWGRGRRAEPRVGAEWQGGRSGAGSPAAQLTTGKNNGKLFWGDFRLHKVEILMQARRRAAVTQPLKGFFLCHGLEFHLHSSASGCSATRRLNWFHCPANPELMHNRDMSLGNVQSKCNVTMTLENKGCSLGKI